MKWFLIFLNIFTLGSIGLLFAYFKKKGENLATKEDIERITEKVEMVKAAVGSQQYIHQFRYQNEFKILLELSEKLVALRDSARTLRPNFDVKENEEINERIERHLNRYHEDVLSFYKLYETRKPFYPEEVYKALSELHYMAWDEEVNYTLGQELDPNYWKKAEVNSDKISKAAESLLELIRIRIRYWEDFEYKR